jgi:hypothetical protein
LIATLAGRIRGLVIVTSEVEAAMIGETTAAVPIAGKTFGAMALIAI